MKKLTSLLLVLVLAFSFSMTAFAADEGESATGTANFANNETSTDVKIIVSTEASANLSATVPLTVTLAVKNDRSVVAPTNYAISNTGAVAVKVTNVKVAGAAGYTFVSPLAAEKQMDLALNAINLEDHDEATGATVTGTTWNVAAGGSLNLTFAGSVWADDISSAKQVFTITYTIAAGTHA
ncbi:MAG: hypothetical protein PHY23_00475 [Oscillospiraceae bacterium]|nr:hypothetical protein [Oscillospiraceae bacterium]